MEHIIKSHTNSIKEYNEDTVYTSESFSFVMDGASGLSSTNHIPGITDVVWYVKWWREYLISELGNLEKSIADILEMGVDLITEAYKNATDDFDSISDFDYPSASLAIVRKTDEGFEHFVLGDCTVLFKFSDGKVQTIKDNRVSGLDKKVIDLISRRKDRLSNTPFEFNNTELDLLRKNRSLKNTDTGYFVLEFDKYAISRGLYGTYREDYVDSFIITSDGFSVSYETYGIVDEISLFDVMESTGPDKFIEQIRKVEKMENSLIEFPRLKVHDDCTVMYYKNLNIL